MKIIINTFGTKVSKFGNCFRISSQNETSDISVKKIEQIIMATASSISTDAIEMALENDVDIMFINKRGDPTGRIWNHKFGSAAKLRRNQLKLMESKTGVVLIQDIILNKLENQIKHLSKLARNRRGEKQEFIKQQIESIKQCKASIKGMTEQADKITDIREVIQGYEGSAGRIYFHALNELIPLPYRFEKRSKHPAKDAFNSMINYGYGIMYGNIQKACIMAGLDPFIGIMHGDQYNKPVLTYDLIEKYRIYIDEIVFKLFSKNQIKDNYFDKNSQYYYLNGEGKKVFFEAYNQMMIKSRRYQKQVMNLQKMIHYDCTRLAKQILEDV